MIRLNCAVQTYAWGNIGDTSIVGKMHKETLKQVAAQTARVKVLAEKKKQERERIKQLEREAAEREAEKQEAEEEETKDSKPESSPDTTEEVKQPKQASQQKIETHTVPGKQIEEPTVKIEPFKPPQGFFNNQEPFAELWIGDHVNGPSTFLVDEPETRLLSDRPFTDAALGLNIKLSELFRRDPRTYLGQYYDETFPKAHGELVCLLKVLSVRTALSIQLHPDAKTAKRLHKEQP